MVNVESEPAVDAAGDLDSCELAGVCQSFEYVAVDTQDGARLAGCHPLACETIPACMFNGSDRRIPSAGSAGAHRRLIGG